MATRKCQSIYRNDKDEAFRCTKDFGHKGIHEHSSLMLSNYPRRHKIAGLKIQWPHTLRELKAAPSRGGR